MHGLVSLLPEPFYTQTKSIWQELETLYGLQGIRVTPYPHFSWQIAQEYDLEALKEALAELSKSITPFPVRTAGLGLFTGPKPVIYISVVKTPSLIDLHAIIWSRLKNVGRGISPYYSPEAWMPHISLAYEDVTPDNIADLMQTLTFRPFAWEMQIDNIALIFEPDGVIGDLKFRFNFSGNS
jgi:2'-5' RNA ligase